LSAASRNPIQQGTKAKLYTWLFLSIKLLIFLADYGSSKKVEGREKNIYFA